MTVRGKPVDIWGRVMTVAEVRDAYEALGWGPVTVVGFPTPGVDADNVALWRAAWARQRRVTTVADGAGTDDEYAWAASGGTLPDVEDLFAPCSGPYSWLPGPVRIISSPTRPEKVRRSGTGGQCSPPAFVAASAQANDSPSTQMPLELADSGLFLLCFIGTDGGTVTDVEWYQSLAPGVIGVDPSPQSFTLIHSDHDGTDHDIEAWGLISPDPSTDVDSEVGASHPDGRNAGAVLAYSGVTAATVGDAVRASDSATGDSAAPSVSIAGVQPGDLLVAALSYHHGGTSTDDTDVTTPTGWTLRAHADKGPPESSTHDAGIDVVERMATGTTATATWTLSTSRQYTAAIVALKQGPG